MGSFFDLDGPFARFGNMLADVMILSLLWLAFSIPVVTAGASTTGLFYVATRRVSNKEGYVFRDFWKSFRENFKQATISWLIILAVGIILYVNITNIEILGNAKVFILPLQLGVALELCVITLYIFPLLSRFEMSIPDLFKNSFIMANRHMPTTIIVLLLGIVIGIVSFITVVFSLFGAGVYALVSSYLFMRIFKTYRPEIDSDDTME